MMTADVSKKVEVKELIKQAKEDVTGILNRKLSRGEVIFVMSTSNILFGILGILYGLKF